MTKPIIVTRTTPDTPIYSRSFSEDHDFIPSDPDSYTVTFVRGRKTGVHPEPVPNSEHYTVDIGRITQRDIPDLATALRVAADMDAQYGQYGRRALIQAVKGFRGYNVPR